MVTLGILLGISLSLITLVFFSRYYSENFNKNLFLTPSTLIISLFLISLLVGLGLSETYEKIEDGICYDLNKGSYVEGYSVQQKNILGFNYCSDASLGFTLFSVILLLIGYIKNIKSSNFWAGTVQTLLQMVFSIVGLIIALFLGNLFKKKIKKIVE